MNPQQLDDLCVRDMKIMELVCGSCVFGRPWVPLAPSIFVKQLLDEEVSSRFTQAYHMQAHAYHSLKPSGKQAGSIMLQSAIC